LAEITNSLPSGDLGIWGSGRDGNSSAHVHTLSLMEGCGGWNARAQWEELVVLKENYRNALCLDGKTVLSSRFAPQIDPLITAAM